MAPGDEEVGAGGSNVEVNQSEMTQATHEQNKQKRTNTRRWVTNVWKMVTLGTISFSRHVPPITLENVNALSLELMAWDELYPDDKCQEYMDKIAVIVAGIKREEEEKKRLDAEEKRVQLQLELMSLQVEKERVQIEKEKAKTDDIKKPKPFVNSPRLDVKIPPFDGSPSHYRRFEELFEAIVEKNPSYDDASKYLHFITLIGKFAHEYAPNLSPTLANLQLVKERLREHFENPGRVREHVKRTFDRLPFVKSPAQTTLLHTLTVAWEEGVLALRKSRTNDEQINNTYVRLMTTHLPGVLIKELQFEEDWTVDRLIASLKNFYKKQLIVNEYSANAVFSPNRDARPRTHNFVVNAEQNRRSPKNNNIVRESCAICAGSHLAIYCNSFDLETRRDIVEQKKLCERCLFPGHHRLDCRSKYKCRCGQPHSRVICGQPSPRPIVNSRAKSPIRPNQLMNSPTINNNNKEKAEDRASQQTKVKTLASALTSTYTTTSMSTPTNNNSIPVEEPHLKYSRPELLVSYYKTVVVRIHGEKVRVLLDGGCGRSSILASTASRLNLPEYAQHELQVSGMGGSDQVTSKRLVMATLQSVVTSHQLDTVLSVVPTFGKFSPASIPEQLWSELCDRGHDISDTPEHHEKPIEIILGLEYIGFIWLDREKLVTEDICIRRSIFGWTAFGVTYKEDKSRKTKKRGMHPITIMCSNYESIPKGVTPSFELTKEEQQYLDEFVTKKVRVEDNQVVVQLPWLNPINLGTNERQAYNRFTHLMKRLRDRGRYDSYSSAMNDMIDKFAERAPLNSESDKVFFLPHHCVVRLDKSTTQTRIVYDGSSSEPGFDSLNDCLFKGVTSWDSLSLLVSFRFGEYALTADIEKAFLQIKVDSKDRDALRFWWIDKQGNPVAYRFTSVPFGTSTSPFLLYAAMYKLFKDTIDKPENPSMAEIAKMIMNRFYVDDLIVSLKDATPEQIKAIRTNTLAMFGKVGMNVRKWRTNHKEVDQQWRNGPPSKEKFLGTGWDTVSDTISLIVDVPPHIEMSVITKRLFSSLLARIYDPMGFVSPYVVQLRLFLRKLWIAGLDWDEPVPKDLRDEALLAIRDANLVNQVSLKRNVLPDDGKESTLVVYCDASKLAIGAVAYSLIDNQPLLVFSRSKLVRTTKSKKPKDEEKPEPLKKKDKDESIAESELNALVMGAELANELNNMSVISFVPDSLKTQTSPPFSKVIICGDSLLNLQRLVKHPNEQRPSIFLRIDKMAKLVPSAEYCHVVSKENPADVISRGSTMTELLNNQKWFHPSPPSEFSRFSDEIRTTIALTIPVDSTCQCSRLPSFKQIVNAWRIIVRKLRRAMSTQRQSVPDIALAKILLMKHIQRRHFPQEIEDLINNKQVDSQSVLRGYNCFLDDDGILRIRTRLHSGANLTEDQVKPILLPEKCHVVELMIWEEHRLLGHPGSDRTMFAIRDSFYVLKLRKYVRRMISQCILCKKRRGKTCTVDFGMVPKFRYDFASTPFTNVGIDIFGPLKVAMTTPGKRYGVIFSCATTRAVHLELMHDMKAESVFQTLLNFMARRGVPHRIYTDNGVNLLAVKKQLLKFVRQISDFHPELNINIDWIQLTVASPWRGGFYERLIRVIKDTLVALTFGKTIDNATLATSLYQIEARINSRPLFVYEGRVITPSDFFAKRPLMQIPPIGSKCYAQCDKPSLIQRYKVMQSHVNAVWHAWYAQYLLTLKSFHQNMFVPDQSDSLRVGDAVILKNPTPCNQWPFGIVDEVVKSEDGRIRTVHVRTHDKGRLTTKARDVRTLIPFECTREIHEETDAEKSVETLTPDAPNSDTALTGSRGE